MAAKIAELMAALPDAEAELVPGAGTEGELQKILATRAVPINSFHRLSLLGGLQAKVAAAYAFHWIRGWFQDASQRERDLAETQFKLAVRVLDTMGYMRGAVMKLGQVLGNAPDVLPEQLVETMKSLHFQAPPMHFSLCREMVVDELGDEPERVFAEFDEVAFAAASLGQVHRARLKSGEEVAVKIQYPGIGRTIRSDFRALLPALLPNRLSRDWQNLKDQVETIRRQFELETDYLREAESQQRVRRLFRDEDGIVVPKVYLNVSTRRILVMDYLPGVHLDDYLGTHPSQEERNSRATKLVTTASRMLYSGRMLNADWHPGNFLFMPDGRLGLLDFGCVLRHESEEEWGRIRRINRAIVTGEGKLIRNVMIEWSQLEDTPKNEEQIRLYMDFGKWCWRPYYSGGEFDFGDPGYIQEGVKIWKQIARKRYTRSHPTNLLQFRWECGYRMMFYRLGAVLNSMPIVANEMKAAGWDHRG